MRKPNVIERVNAFGEVQKIYRFPNNYGASVVRGEFTYEGDRGLWELAVIKFTNEDNNSWNLYYASSITGDVLGSLTEDEVDAVLTQIEALPKE